MANGLFDQPQAATIQNQIDALAKQQLRPGQAGLAQRAELANLKQQLVQQQQTTQEQQQRDVAGFRRLEQLPPGALRGGAGLGLPEALGREARGVGAEGLGAELAQRTPQAIQQAELEQTQARAGLENPLRTAFTAATRLPFDVVNSVKQVENLLDIDDPFAVEVALIGMGRAADPGVSVRPSEVEAMRGGFAIRESAMLAFNKWRAAGFTPEARETFRKTMKALVQPQAERALQTIAAFRQNAIDLGVNPDNVVGLSGVDEDELRRMAVPLNAISFGQATGRE